MQTFWDNRDTLESVPQFGLGSLWHKLEYQWDVCRVMYGLTWASMTAHITFTVFLCLCVYSSNDGKSVHLDKLTITLNVILERVALLHHIWEIPGSNPVPETNWCEMFCLIQSPKANAEIVPQSGSDCFLPHPSQVIITHPSIQHYWASDSS